MPSLALRSLTSNRARRGVKARRRTELGLLVAGAAIIVATYVLMILGNTSKVPSNLTPLLSTLVSCAYLGVTPAPRVWGGAICIAVGSLLCWKAVKEK